MTPDELTAKLQAGDQLSVRQREFHRLSYTTEVGGPKRASPLGLISDQNLVNSLVGLGSVYTSDVVTYLEFEDPAEAIPKVPAYLLASKLDEPQATVATIDDTLATQLAAISAADVALIVGTLRPDTSSDQGGGGQLG